MDLTGIITISGRPGLYKVIAQGKNNIIVESLIDNKRFPAYAADKISALDDISIYTYDDDAPLRDLLKAVYDKESGKECISHKEDLSVLQSYLLEILPNYDQERVYPSDVKKMFQWYNLLHQSGNLKLLEVKEDPASDKDSKTKKEDTDEESPIKEAATKKTTVKKPVAAKPKAAGAAKPIKPGAAKKVTATKTSSNRGK